MRSASKLGLLLGLYFSQGLPFGFFTQAMPVLMRQQGISLETIGLANLLYLPWAFKFAWAPLVDRLGTRRAAIIPLQLALVLMAGVLSYMDPARSLTNVLGAVFIGNLLAATQDIATDGLAVDLLNERERGLGNAMQVAGYRMGMIVGGGALLIAFDSLGWRATFWLMGALLLLATLPIALYREPRRARNIEAGNPFQPLFDFFKQPGAWAWLGVLVSYKAGDAFFSAMVRPFFIDRGLSMGDIGWLLGTFGFTAGLLGALAGGWLVGRLGRRRALIQAGLVQAAVFAAYALAAPGQNLNVIYALCTIEYFVGGLATVSLFTAMMDVCRPAHGATDYTIQASAVVVAGGAVAALSGFSAARLGYSGHFAVSVFVVLLGVAVAWRYREREAFPMVGSTDL